MGRPILEPAAVKAMLGKLTILKSSQYGIATGGDLKNRRVDLKAGEILMVVAVEPLPTDAISQWYGGSRNVDYLRVLPSSGRECWIYPEHVFPIYRRNALTGMSFCITGTLTLRREFYIQLIEAHGGIWKNTVTKNLAYLIIAEPDTTSLKISAAKQNGVVCIDEKTLFHFIATS